MPICRHCNKTIGAAQLARHEHVCQRRPDDDTLRTLRRTNSVPAMERMLGVSRMTVTAWLMEIGAYGDYEGGSRRHLQVYRELAPLFGASGCGRCFARPLCAQCNSDRVPVLCEALDKSDLLEAMSEFNNEIRI